MKFRLLLRSVSLLCLMLFAASNPSRAQVPKVIFSGVVSNAATLHEDLGTVVGVFVVQVDSVYRTNEFILKDRTVTLQVEHSFLNSTVDEAAFEKAWNELQGQRVVVYTDHLQGLLIWERDVRIVKFADLQADELPKYQGLSWLIIRELPQNRYSSDCALCEAFRLENDKRVLRLLKKELKRNLRHPKKKSPGLLAYPCVKWVISPEAVNLTLPAFASTVVVLKNEARRKELYYTIQLGRGSKLFGLVRAKVEVNKLIDIDFQDSLISSWLNSQHFILNYSLRDGDTLPYPIMDVPDEWLLLRDKYERPDHNFFNMHPTQEYLWEISLTEMEAGRKIYNLCLLSGHINPQVRVKALQALERIGDLPAVPYLLELLKFETTFDWEVLNEAERNDKVAFRAQLLRTLSTMLHTSLEFSTKDLISPQMLQDYYTFLNGRVTGGALRSF